MSELESHKRVHTLHEDTGYSRREIDSGGGGIKSLFVTKACPYCCRRPEVRRWRKAVVLKKNHLFRRFEKKTKTFCFRRFSVGHRRPPVSPSQKLRHALYPVRCTIYHSDRKHKHRSGMNINTTLYFYLRPEYTSLGGGVNEQADSHHKERDCCCASMITQRHSGDCARFALDTYLPIHPCSAIHILPSNGIAVQA